MTSQIVSWACAFTMMIVLPRFLGDVDFGRYYFAISLTAMMTIIIDLGIGNYFVISVARNKSQIHSLFANGVALRTIVWLIVFIGTMAYVILQKYPVETQQLVFILGFGKLLDGPSELAHRVFQAHEKLKYRSIAIIVERIFQTVVGVAMLLLGYSVLSICIVQVLSNVLSFGTNLYLLPRVVKLRWTIRREAWLPILKGGLPFLISSGISFIYYRIDIVLLSKLSSDSVVGWYGAPFRLFDSLMFFPSMLQLAVVPVLARLWEASKDALQSTVRKVLVLTVMVAVPLTVILFTSAPQIVDIMFGLKQYSNSVILLQILSFCLLFEYVNFHMSTVIVSTDKQHYMPLIAGVALVINVGSNLYLIPYFQATQGNGAIGAAVVTVITELSVTIMMWLIAPPKLFGGETITLIGKIGLAGICMAGLIVLGKQLGGLWFIYPLAGVVIYVALLLALKVLRKEELTLLLNMIPIRRRSAPPIIKNDLP